MKREKLLEKVNEAGAVFVRHGRKHDINENTARDILKKLSK